MLYNDQVEIMLFCLCSALFIYIEEKARAKPAVLIQCRVKRITSRDREPNQQMSKAGTFDVTQSEFNAQGSDERQASL